MTSARTTTSSPPLLRALLVACVTATLALVGALPASAHAALIRSSPTAGSTLTAVPPEVALTFNEPIDSTFTSVTVKGGGATASTGKPTVDGATVYQPLDPTMAEGTYTVAYRVTSADGHPVSGSYTFTYRSSGGEDPEGGSPSGSSSEPSGTSTAEPSASTGGSSSSSTGSSGTQSPSTESSGTETSSTDSSTESSSTDSGTETGTESSSSTNPETPSTTSSAPSTTTDEPAQSTADDAEGGTPAWVWLLAALAGLALLGGLVAFLRARSARDDDELDLRDGEDDDLR